MSRIKKEIDRKIAEANHLAAERDRMEQFCIMDFQGDNTLEKYEAWVAKVKAMTTEELTKEYNRRDGDYVREHGCHPEHREEHE